MVTWKNWSGHDIPIPAEMVAYCEEYEQLCRKHGMMVCSDGESVEIGETDETLWSLRTGAASHPERWPKVVPCQPADQEWEMKCWGRVRHCFSSPDVAISYLEVIEKTRSSWHLHHDRFNGFYVTAGTVIVEVEIDNLITQVELRAGRSFTVEPRLKHRFRVVRSGRLVETYWPAEGKTCRADDIERFDVGGPDE